MSFLSFSILRKVKDENENVWDDFINGALFVIYIKVSSTTKFSPFSIMFGRQPWLPFEVEKFLQQTENGEEINRLAAELTSLQAYLDKMATTRNVLFPKVERSITIAQGKQKKQYQKRKGELKKSFKKGDVMLRRNMLQKSKHLTQLRKFYFENRTRQLRGQDGKILKRKTNLKDVKIYKPQQVSSGDDQDGLS